VCWPQADQRPFEAQRGSGQPGLRCAPGKSATRSFPLEDLTSAESGTRRDCNHGKEIHNDICG
jgi:hypothetical protein